MATKLLPPSKPSTTPIPASQNWGAEDNWLAELNMTQAQRDRLYASIHHDPTGDTAVRRVMGRKGRGHRSARGKR